MLRLMPLLLILGAALPLQAAETSTPPAATVTATADADAKPERPRKASCGQTGSRIKGGNRSQPLRCYSRNDLARTGATDLHDALRRLDPTIR